MYEHHGYCNHSLYKVWENIKKRCYNTKGSQYKNYGGRGIEVCGDWLNHPNIFIGWALDNGWEKGLRIDRIDNDGNYCPENCRFVNHTESNHNTRLLRKTNISGYRGVSWDKERSKWLVSIRINRKTLFLGRFNSLRLAAIRYDVEAYLNDNRPRNFILKH